MLEAGTSLSLNNKSSLSRNELPRYELIESEREFKLDVFLEVGAQAGAVDVVRDVEARQLRRGSNQRPKPRRGIGWLVCEASDEDIAGTVHHPWARQISKNTM